MDTQTREKYLRIALIVFGMIFLVGLLPMTLLFPDSWMWEPRHAEYEQMILIIYAVLGVLLVRKTLATEAAEATVRQAAVVAGGSSFYRTENGVGIEQLLRDVQAAAFHPLPKPRQLEFSGNMALGQPPVASAGVD